MEDIDVDALVDEAEPLELSMPLCLRMKLVAKYEELERRRLEAVRVGGDSLAGIGGEATAIAAEMEALRERMLSGTITVVMRSMPRKKYKALTALHPPRRTDEGGVDDRDFMGINADTFYDPLIRACWVAPVLSPDRLTKILDEIASDKQYDELAQLALNVNRAKVDVPFSAAASSLTRTSEPE